MDWRLGDRPWIASRSVFGPTDPRDASSVALGRFLPQCSRRQIATDSFSSVHYHHHRLPPTDNKDH